MGGRLQQTQVGLDQRLDALGRRLGDGLMQHSERTRQTLSTLNERLALIDAAQANIGQLAKQVVGLQDILANKQARGAFGEMQLEALVGSMLPPDAYEFQATLSQPLPGRLPAAAARAAGADRHRRQVPAGELPDAARRRRRGQRGCGRRAASPPT